MKQEASSMEEWKIDMDYASNQAAAVLERLHEQLEEIRYAPLACELLYGYTVAQFKKCFDESVTGILYPFDTAYCTCSLN